MSELHRIIAIWCWKFQVHSCFIFGNIEAKMTPLLEEIFKILTKV